MTELLTRMLNEFAKQNCPLSVPWLGRNKCAASNLPQTMYYDNQSLIYESVKAALYQGLFNKQAFLSGIRGNGLKDTITHWPWN